MALANVTIVPVWARLLPKRQPAGSRANKTESAEESNETQAFDGN
jgi:hypothetical protein